MIEPINNLSVFSTEQAVLASGEIAKFRSPCDLSARASTLARDDEEKTPDKLMAAARQFEAVFLNQLFNAIDSTVEKDSMFSGGKGEEMFRSMFFDEIAKDTASSPTTSFGFAKQIYEQMKNKV